MQILRHFPFTNSCFRKLKFCVKNNWRKILCPSELHKPKGLEREPGLENNESNTVIVSDFWVNTFIVILHEANVLQQMWTEQHICTVHELEYLSLEIINHGTHLKGNLNSPNGGCILGWALSLTSPNITSVHALRFALDGPFTHLSSSFFIALSGGWIAWVSQQLVTHLTTRTFTRMKVTLQRLRREQRAHICSLFEQS